MNRRRKAGGSGLLQSVTNSGRPGVLGLGRWPGIPALVLTAGDWTGRRQSKCAPDLSTPVLSLLKSPACEDLRGLAGCDMWVEVVEAGSLLAAAICARGWLTASRRLAETAREREDLANSSAVIEVERRMLELVAQGAPLREVLNTLTAAIERISPQCQCTVMLLDEESRRTLLVASGPSLSQAYLQAINGLEIGPDVGACGTAAFKNETVVVEDIANDPKFASARAFVLSHGLRSCWSQPVRDSTDTVL